MKDRDTVLVVDDDPIIRDLVTTILESELGVRVVAVRDGPPVAALAREISPLLVILDVRLPGKSGIEVICSRPFESEDGSARRSRRSRKNEGASNRRRTSPKPSASRCPTLVSPCHRPTPRRDAVAGASLARSERPERPMPVSFLPRGSTPSREHGMATVQAERSCPALRTDVAWRARRHSYYTTRRFRLSAGGLGLPRSALRLGLRALGGLRRRGARAWWPSRTRRALGGGWPLDGRTGSRSSRGGSGPGWRRRSRCGWRGRRPWCRRGTGDSDGGLGAALAAALLF